MGTSQEWLEGAESRPRSQVLKGWGQGAALTFKTGASEAGSQVLMFGGGDTHLRGMWSSGQLGSSGLAGPERTHRGGKET